jgi:GDP-L-fucose synthase
MSALAREIFGLRAPHFFLFFLKPLTLTSTSILHTVVLRSSSMYIQSRPAESPIKAHELMSFESIYVAGHRGLVGSAVLRNLQRNGYRNVLVRTHQQLDLRNAEHVRKFFSATRPQAVIIAAAKVGGIKANSDYPVEFLLENLDIQNNLISASFEFGVSKLLFLGSSCIYPKLAPQPIQEESLLTGFLEPTNEPYAIAKIAGIKLCQAYAREYGAHFISAMPTNLYGPGDNFDLTTSHVLPALLRKVHETKLRGEKQVMLWGTGTARREFLHADDLADALRFLIECYDSPEIINVGWGEDISIRELAELVLEVVGFDAELVFDAAKPDGTPRKLLDITRLQNLGWKPRISLRDGIRQTYQWFLQNCEWSSPRHCSTRSKSGRPSGSNLSLDLIPAKQCF